MAMIIFAIHKFSGNLYESYYLLLSFISVTFKRDVSIIALFSI